MVERYSFSSTKRPEPRAPAYEAPSRDGDLIDLGRIASAIWRNAWIIALVVLACGAAAFAYLTVVATPIYRASATVLLDPGEPAFAELPSVVTDTEYDDTAINTEVAILRSPGLMADVIDGLGLQDDPEFNPYLGDGRAALAGLAPEIAAERETAGTVRNLQEAISVTNVPNTYIFSVAAETTSPEKSRNIANALAEAYLQAQVAQKTATTQEAVDWLSGRLEELKGQLAGVESQIENFRFGETDANRFEDTVALERLTGEAQALRELYQYFLTRLKETAAQQGLTRPDGRVLSSAVLPAVPSSPRKAVTMFVAVVLGGILGLGLVFLREATATELRRPRDLEAATGYPLLGSLPRVRGGNGRAARAPLRNPRFATAIDDLRLTLLMMSERSTPKVIAFASANPREGKSGLALAMAASFGSAGARTLLIDGDLRQLTISRQVPPQVGQGLLALCEGSVDLGSAVTHDEALSIDVLGCEQAPEKPLEVLQSPRLAEILAEARAAYDVVIVDTAPILAVPDMRAVGPLADAIVFVARHGVTRAEAVHEAIIALERVDQAPIGVVMTQLPPGLIRRAGVAQTYGLRSGYEVARRRPGDKSVSAVADDTRRTATARPAG